MDKKVYQFVEVYHNLSIILGIFMAILFHSRPHQYPPQAPPTQHGLIKFLFSFSHPLSNYDGGSGIAKQI